MKPETIAKRKAELENAIKEAGSPYKAALKLGVTPSSLYERAHRYGIEINSHPFDLWSGEPVEKADKKVWFESLLATRTISEIAKEFNRTYSTVHERIKTLGIIYTGNLLEGEPIDPKKRKQWFKDLLAQHGSVKKLSEVLGIKPASIYERCDNYGIRMRHCQGEPEGTMADKKVWLEDLLKGRTMSQVAKKLGRAHGSIYSRIKKYGIDYPVAKDPVPEENKVEEQITNVA